MEIHHTGDNDVPHSLGTCTLLGEFTQHFGLGLEKNESANL